MLPGSRSCDMLYYVSDILCLMVDRERIGSVVECLNRDRGDACSSLTGVTALCP